MQIRYNRNEPVMKTKKVRIERSKTGKSIVLASIHLDSPDIDSISFAMGIR